MAKYTVKSRLDHDNKPYIAGEPIELKEAVAAPLLAIGVLEPAPEKKNNDKDSGGEPALLDNPIPKIIEAIAARDADGILEISHIGLGELIEAEKKGKNRSTLIAALEEQLAQRLQAATNL